MIFPPLGVLAHADGGIEVAEEVCVLRVLPNLISFYQRQPLAQPPEPRVNFRRLAASVLKCGKRKIWLDPNEISEISMANSRK